MSIILGVLEQGLIYGIMALGVYITYKILDFPDLTVDGSFPLGAAVTVALLEAGCNPYLALLAALLAGAVAGTVTGLIHVKGGVRDLLSGIITMTALYSINIYIAGKANVPIFKKETIFRNSFVDGLFAGDAEPFKTLVIVLVVTLAVKLALDFYMRTRSGYLLKAAGDNPAVVISIAKDVGTIKILGLAIANGLAALAGSVLCQQQRFFDVSMGTGTIVMGLAMVIVGTKLFRGVRFLRATSAVLIGAVIYKACISLAISANLSSTDMKLITAVLFLIILLVSNFFGKKVQRIEKPKL